MEPISQILENSQRSILDPKNYDEMVEREDKERQSRILTLRGIINPAHTFENLIVPKGYEVTFNTLKDMAEGLASYSMVLVYGGTGNGKTTICEATVLRLLERNMPASRQRWSDLVRAMRSHFNGKGSVPYEDYFSDLRARLRLIIDDVGSGTTWGDWEQGEFEDIIDYRYEHRLLTVITANMDIKNFPERVLSRFRDKSVARLVLNEAPDRRPINE